MLKGRAVQLAFGLLAFVAIAVPVAAETLYEAQKLPAPISSGRVAVDGDTAVVSRGATYIFTRDRAGTWSEQGQLMASGAVAVAGDTVVVGATGDDDRGDRAGAAYVFVRDRAGTSWSEQAKLLASDGAAGDAFGWSVAAAGDRAVIGAKFDDTEDVRSAGSAYVFTRDRHDAWHEQAKLLPGEIPSLWDGWDPQFGESAAASGNSFLIGSYDGAFVFTRARRNTWREAAELTGPDQSLFGVEVALSGDTAVVGAPWDNNENGNQAGAAYVFIRDGRGDWTRQARLLAGDGERFDNFGASVAVAGDAVIVGASRNDEMGRNAGAAYLFTRDARGRWRQEAKLLATDGGPDRGLGRRSALAGDTAVVAGADAYVFLLPLTPDQRLTALHTEIEALVELGTVPKGLLSPIRAAEKQLSKGNTRPTINQIRAFTRQIQAMVRSGRLSEAEGDALIHTAERLIESIRSA